MADDTCDFIFFVIISSTVILLIPISGAMIFVPALSLLAVGGVILLIGASVVFWINIIIVEIIRRFRGGATIPDNRQLQHSNTNMAMTAGNRPSGVRRALGPSINRLRDGNQARNEAAESTFCVVCLENDRDTAILPCGHTHSCLACLRRVRNNRCPVCQQGIEDVQRIFI